MMLDVTEDALLQVERDAAVAALAPQWAANGRWRTTDPYVIWAYGSYLWIYHQVCLPVLGDYGAVVAQISGSRPTVAVEVEALEQLEQQAGTDRLTGLLNRSEGLDRLQRVLAHPRRTGPRVALLSPSATSTASTPWTKPRASRRRYGPRCPFPLPRGDQEITTTVSIGITLATYVLGHRPLCRTSRQRHGLRQAAWPAPGHRPRLPRGASGRWGRWLQPEARPRCGQDRRRTGESPDLGQIHPRTPTNVTSRTASTANTDAMNVTCRRGRPVVAIESGHEEGDVDRDEHREGAPPGVDPDEGRGLRQEDLENRKTAALPTAKTSRLLTPRIFIAGSAGSSLLNIKPAMENIRLSSTPTPMSSRKAVPAGTVHSAWPEKCCTSPFRISKNQWTP